MLTLLQNYRIDQFVWIFTQVNDGLFNFSSQLYNIIV